MSVPELISKLQMRTRRRAVRTRFAISASIARPAAWRKHHADRGSSTREREWHWRGLDFAGSLEVPLLPQFLEIRA